MNRPLAVLALGLGMVFPSLRSATAQPGNPDTPAATPARAPRAEPAAPSASQPGPVISISFRGGTLSEFVAAVIEAARKAGHTVNVIVPQDARGLEVPAVELSSVTSETALRSLKYAFAGTSATGVNIVNAGGEDQPSLTFAVLYADHRPPFGPNPPSQGGSPAAAPRAPAAPAFSRVHSLAPLVEPPDGLGADPALVVPVDHILSALRAAAELDAAAQADPEDAHRESPVRRSPPEFLLHEDSNLLIVRGDAAQHTLVESVLGELRESVSPRRDRAASAADEARARELQLITERAQLRQAEIAVARTEDEVKAASEKADQVRQLVERGALSDDSEFVGHLNTARRNRDQAAALLDAARARLAVLEAAAGGGAGHAGASPRLSGKGVQIIYEIKDLEPLHEDVYRFVKAVVPGDWDQAEPYSQPAEPGAKPTGDERALREWRLSDKMTLTATPAQHRIVVGYLNSIRRAKANEPDLPGLDAEGLIREAEGRTE